jgi:RHS repeat-associated protein
MTSLITNNSITSNYFPTYDGNGNVSEYLDSTGTVVAHYEYDPFGKTTVATGPKANDFAHRFSTKPLDATTGLYYYGYRFYDPETGRWPSRDPIEERGGVNLYGFVGNDGVNGWDYLGWAKGVFRVAFRGAGDIDPESEFAGFTGNLYSSTDVGSGLKAVIGHYDTDGDGRLTKKDCPPFRVKIVGYSWGGISALYLAKQIGGKTEEPDKNLHIGIGTLDPVTTLRGGGGSAVTGGLPGYVRKAYNNYQTNGMWRGPLGVFGAGAFKGSSVAGAVNKDHSSDRPGGRWASMGDPKKPWEDHISIQRHAAGLVSKVQAIDLAGEK